MATAECRTWVIEWNELKTTNLEIRLPRWSFCKIYKKYVNDPIRVIPREVAQENHRPPSILMKIDKPIVPHDRNMYAQF